MATRYATVSELDAFAASADIVSTLSEDDKGGALDIASALCDGYLAQRYTLPIIAWCPDLKRAALAIASYDLISARGYDPAATDNGNIRQRYLDAIEWLKAVASGELTPEITDSSDPETDPNPAFPGFAIWSLPPRWFL